MSFFIFWEKDYSDEGTVVENSDDDCETHIKGGVCGSYPVRARQIFPRGLLAVSSACALK